MKAVWLAIMMVLLGAQAWAAPESEGQTALYRKSWARQDGAPAASYAMTQDSRGMLWFTYGSGLVHFDGVQFQATDQVQGHKLLSSTTNVVSAIGDALWVLYGFGGASVFEHGKVRHYGQDDGLPARTSFAIAATATAAYGLPTAPACATSRARASLPCPCRKI